MREHPAPDESQRNQPAPYPIGVVPCHEPTVAVRVCPWVVAPLVVGTAVFTGGAAATAALCTVDTEADPYVLAAVTRARSVSPMSDETIEYADDVAPAIVVQPAPCVSQRNHW